MKKLFIIVAILSGIFIAGAVGVFLEREARSDFVYEQWRLFYQWTNSEKNEFKDLMADIEMTPKDVSETLQQIQKHNDAMGKMMENDESMTAIMCINILNLLDNEETEEAKEICINRLAYYANSPAWPNSELAEQREKVKEKIFELSDQIPELKQEIDNQSQ